MYYHGQQAHLNFLVFELLGPNLEDLFRYCENQFSMRTTLVLATNSCVGLKPPFKRLPLPRVKPESFLLGTGTRGNTVYMIDLGLASYRHPDRRSSDSLLLVYQHVPLRFWAPIDMRISMGVWAFVSDVLIAFMYGIGLAGYPHSTIPRR